MTNLIENAYLLNRAGERIPVGNHISCTGEVLGTIDPRLLEIDELAHDVELLDGSKDITIAVEREDLVDEDMALSFYAKGNMKNKVIITVSLYNANGTFLSAQIFSEILNKDWERYIDFIIELTAITDYLTIKFENDSSVEPIYIAMPQLEIGDESTDFEIGG